MLCPDDSLEITPIYGEGSNVREWIYVEYNCRAIETVRKHGEVGEVYNIGRGKERTNLEVAHEVLDAVDADADLIEFVEDRLGHDQRYALDNPKLEALGGSPLDRSKLDSSRLSSTILGPNPLTIKGQILSTDADALETPHCFK